jgi:hypothetical protein
MTKCGLDDRDLIPERGKAFVFTTKFTGLVPVELNVYWISLKQFLKISIPSYTTRLGCGRVRTTYAHNNYKYLSIIVFVLLLEIIILCEYVRG